MCLITGLATALGVSTAAVWGGLASAAVGIGSAVAGSVVSSVQAKKAESKQNEMMRQLQETNKQQPQSLADRQMETASKVSDRAAMQQKRNIASLRVPMLKTQGTGMNPAVDTGNGLNLGG